MLSFQSFKNWFYCFEQYLLRIPIWKFILVILGLGFIFDLITVCIFYITSGEKHFLEGDNPFSVYDTKQPTLYFLLIYVAPIAETFIFQYLIIKLVRVITHKMIIAILISASLFSLAHYHSIISQVVTFSSGLLYAWSYFLATTKGSSPFWVIAGIHALHNAILSVFIYFGQDFL